MLQGDMISFERQDFLSPLLLPPFLLFVCRFVLLSFRLLLHENQRECVLCIFYEDIRYSREIGRTSVYLYTEPRTGFFPSNSPVPCFFCQKLSLNDRLHSDRDLRNASCKSFSSLAIHIERASRGNFAAGFAATRANFVKTNENAERFLQALRLWFTVSRAFDSVTWQDWEVFCCKQA